MAIAPNYKTVIFEITFTEGEAGYFEKLEGLESITDVISTKLMKVSSSPFGDVVFMPEEHGRFTIHLVKRTAGG